MVRLPPRPPEGYPHERDPWRWTNLVRNSVASVPYQVHERYLHHKSQEPLTIRYLGTLNSTGKTPGTWIGVEYDDATKGKHDGVFQASRIFPVKQAGGGAFIKATPEVVFGKGRTFVEAFEERYGVIDPSSDTSGGDIGEGETAPITLGSSNGAILVEAPGLERVKQNIGKLEKLREVGLEGEWVYTLGASDRQKVIMRERLKGVTTLNLSRNLLSSWVAVGEIADCLPNLETLVLNQTRLRTIDHRTPVVGAFQGIKELHLGRSVILWMDVITIARHFPSLQRLYLNNNPTLDRIPDLGEVEQPFAHLQLLDLAGCGMNDWPALCSSLAQLPALETLNISETPLTSIPSRTPTCPSPPRLHSLIFLDAQISLLTDLDALQTYLPHLASLRFSPPASAFSAKRPITQGPPPCLQIVPPGAGEDYETRTMRPLIIAKFPSLTTLNSTPISPQERRDAELGYIAHVRGLLSPEYPETRTEEWGQWDLLCAKYEAAGEVGTGQVVPEKRKTSALKSKMIKLNIRGSNAGTLEHEAEVSILPSAAVSSLIRKIEKAFSISGATVWTTRMLDGEIDKVASIESGKVGDWLGDEDIVWVEST